MFNQKIFQKRLEKLRQDKNLTLNNFGGIFGISKQSTSRWENGVNLPTINTLYEICENFNISSDYLLGLSYNPNRK